MRADFCATDPTAPGRATLAAGQLLRLAQKEGVVRAFVCYDADAARQRVEAAVSHGVHGALSGALIAVKDLFVTRRFPTHFGSPFAENRGPLEDAWCVQVIEKLGGTVLGKTVSTEFGFQTTAGPTTNPCDPTRTPGGSSSGSAAAVAAGFVSFALGTQTGGSTIRPASYCGITGYKPTFGLLPRQGLQPVAATLDHLGLLAVSARDVWYLMSAMLFAKPEVLTAKKPRRVWIPQLPAQMTPGDGYAECMALLAEDLAAEGIRVERDSLPVSFEDFVNLQPRICLWEAARALLCPGRLRLTDKLYDTLLPHLSAPLDDYRAAVSLRQQYQQRVAQLFAECDAILMPAATGAAPVSLHSTGSASMNLFWTTIHVPVATVPYWRATGNLPLGLQLVGALGADRELLQVAQWFQERGNPA